LEVEKITTLCKNYTFKKQKSIDFFKMLLAS
jgi:hypothetical protein